MTLDQTIALVGAVVSVVSAVAAVVTVYIAFKLAEEARRIRRLDSLASSIRNWSDFSRLVLEHDPDDRWHAVRAGSLAYDALKPRDFMILYAFLNVLVFEYKARDGKAIDPAFANKSVSDNIGQLVHIWPQLHEHLLTDGWPEDFVRAADTQMTKGTTAPATPAG